MVVGVLPDGSNAAGEATDQQGDLRLQHPVARQRPSRQAEPVVFALPDRSPGQSADVIDHRRA